MNLNNVARELTRLVVNGFQDWKSLGEIKVKESPDGNLLIFNYTPEAAFKGWWNEYERVCRGLIIGKDGEVVARPFDKFFNWGQGGRVTRAAVVEVTEKLDGSLGIGYFHEGKWRVATRGSFTSEQAMWATEFLYRNYDMTEWPTELTPLFEIIYPENRIVVDYGEREDLVLIGVRNRFSGKDYWHREFEPLARRFGFSLPKVYQYDDVESILTIANTLPADEEGFVIRFADGQRFKVKGREYLRIHKIINHLSPRHIYEAWRDYDVSWSRNLPDEFLDLVENTFWEYDKILSKIVNEVKRAYAVAPKDNRKTYALWVRKYVPHLAKYMFIKLDGGNIREAVRKDSENFLR